MSKTANEARERRSKSYRGCTPCKLARRKCPEEKPVCSHCEKIGVKCEYDTESLFRFQEFQYEGGNKRLTQSAKRAPGSKRKASSPPSAAADQPSKQPRPAKSSAPPAVAPKLRKRPTNPKQSTSNSLISSTVAIRPQPPWAAFPVQDPFYDLFCGEDDNSTEDTYRTPSSPTTSTSLSPPNSFLPLLYNPALAPDPDIPQADLPYLSFFLAEMSNVLPYVNIFPSTVPSLFSSSIHHPALRHSVLSISSLIADKKSHRGKERALEHLQKSLKLLQTSLSAVEVDEGLAISIFLLAYFNVSSGEHLSARKHLAGLCMVMEQLQQDHLVRNAGVLSPYAISPLTMLVWRMAIRMDFILALMYGQRPIFPIIADDQEEFHRQWICLFADRSEGEKATEWALAWFALDNLMHRTCHVASDAFALRRGTGKRVETESRIQRFANLLLHQNSQWLKRAVVEEAEKMERTGEVMSIGTSNPNSRFPFDTILPTAQSPDLGDHQDEVPILQFLNYPPVKLTNFFYANLLNHHRSIEIYISLIPRPIWGAPDPRCFQCAIDLCCTHAALGKERNFLTTGKIWGLHLSGVSFGGPESYPRESQWVIDRLEEIGSYYPAASITAANLRKIWAAKGSYWEAAEKIYNERCRMEGNGEIN